MSNLPHEEDLLIYDLNAQKGTFKLLIILFNHGRLFGNKILSYGMNDRTLIKARRVLLKFGLLSLTHSSGSRRIYYELTEKGYRVAQHLIDMERLLLVDFGKESLSHDQ
ncbi:MAG: hypothetical protein U9O98_03195 [Asgard group archaeon]|nr:hypothetical protein [Asgard group archaeon]